MWIERIWSMPSKIQAKNWSAERLPDFHFRLYPCHFRFRHRNLRYLFSCQWYYWLLPWMEVWGQFDYLLESWQLLFQTGFEIWEVHVEWYHLRPCWYWVLVPLHILEDPMRFDRKKRPSIILVLKYPLLHSYRYQIWAVRGLFGFTNSQFRFASHTVYTSA